MVIRIAAAILLLAAGAAQADSTSTIAGSYLEARSGHVYTCGCLYSGEMVTSGREAILAWSFDSGAFEGVSLAGVRALAIVSAEENLGIQNEPRQSVLYLDGIVTASQEDAVVTLLQRKYADVVGEIIGRYRGQIQFRSNDDGVDVEVPGVARVRARPARLPADAHLGSIRWYEPFIPLTRTTMATSTLYGYQGPDFEKQWRQPEAGINSYYGSFALGR